MYNKKITAFMEHTGHVQGIAVDKERKYIYYSFTIALLKTDMEGNIIGSVKGLAGHLGCIAYNYEDGRIYGSLEYKNDVIGKGILGRLTDLDRVTDGFYIAIFDVEKIDRMDMDAEKDGVMKAVFLSEVLEDYRYPNHRYGCSGIDGTTIAPAIGRDDGGLYLYVAYGIYSDVDREDNDYQVILCYDVKKLTEYAQPLVQTNMHRSGPEEYEHKYFVYTGNTSYGVQNLEYDPYTKRFIMAVYQGKKEQFPNYSMFMMDAQMPAKVGMLKGIGHEGEILSLAPMAKYDGQSGVYGSYFPYGATGVATLGEGYYYFSQEWFDAEKNRRGTDVTLYKLNDNGDFEVV